MRIEKVEAFPFSLSRDLTSATGTAGSPSCLSQERRGAYKWSTTVPAVYSDRFETTLIKVTMDAGLEGWGEAQAPVAPRVSAAIVNDLLAGLLEGQDFDGSRAAVEAFYDSMYRSMRVRGQTGGFMLDAIAGIDIALWDLAGKLQNLPVSRLIAPATAKTLVPAYVSGLAGADIAARVAYAREQHSLGFRLFKIFFDADEAQLMQLLDALRAELGPDVELAVDALWRLEWPANGSFLEALAERDLLWVEAPFMPDEPRQHLDFARAMPGLPLALGESYRTRREMSWFLDEGIVRYAQPDLGRCGITGTLRIAEAGVEVVPHVSIALGPQIAAAVHTSAALSDSPFCEYNPAVLTMANRMLRGTPLAMQGPAYAISGGVGLGIDLLPFAAHHDGTAIESLPAAPALQPGE